MRDGVNMGGRYDPVIKKKDLRHGAYYMGRCRNATIARWHGERQLFYYWRNKMGWFVEDIHCPEDEKHFDVFVAEKELEVAEKEIPFPE